MTCWTQALGWETHLTPDPAEVVGLSGNSTRAGAALALATAALGASLVGTGSDRGSRLPRLALLALLAGALVLTRGRGARLALGGAGLVALAAAWARHERRPGGRVAQLALALLLGLAGAVAVAGGDALSARKLDDQAPILSGQDPTTTVRLSLLGTAAAMAADHPLQGVGLGRFEQYSARYRDQAEAARPGLAGAATVADHPHNEFALAWAEGGWPWA